MKIKLVSLRVQDCGPLRDIKLDFINNKTGLPLPIILLGGANGTGKTTALELVFALMDLFKFSSGANFNSIDNLAPDILKRAGYAELTLSVDDDPCLVFFRKSPDEIINYCPNKHGIVADYDENDNLQWKMASSGEIPKQINQFIKYTKKNLIGFPFYTASFVESPKYSAPTILYFPYNRELFPVKGKQIYREQGNYTFTCHYELNKTFEGSFESYLIWLDYADPDLFKLVLDFLNQLKFGGKTFHINRKDLSVIVRTKDEREHRLNQLSSGEQNILIMLFEIRRRITPGSIVLIDEIENSLHPEFQQYIAKGLLELQRQIPFQLLLTTHQHEFVKIFGHHCTRILTEF